MSKSEPAISDSVTHSEEAGEIGVLRARVTELEARLVEVEDWANRAVAAAQERVYWLDRWHIDLNELMRRPGAGEFRAAIRGVRAVFRWCKRIKGRFSGRT